ncbi:MAG: hypothetical protein STSR0008_11530 [Ignavibacterium sp.]
MKIKSIILFFLIWIVPLLSQPEIPKLNQFANDLTNTLSMQQLNELNTSLKKFEDTTSNQVVFLMVNTLDGYPIEEYSYEVATNNKIGTKNLNNGILFLIVKKDRLVRLEVGYGLEGALPDATANYIIRNEVIPHLKSNDYYAGIYSGINAIIKSVAGEYKVAKKKKDNDDLDIATIIFILIFIFMSFIFRGRRRSFYFGGFPRGGTGVGSLGGFGGGGSFGGFGGGGFSGGGGSFGGGGSTGSW